MQTKKCPSCGKENLPDVLFCGYCGASLSAKTITSFVELTDSELKALAPKPALAPETVPAQKTMPAPVPAVKPRKAKAIIAAAVCLAIVGGVGGVIALKTSNGGTSAGSGIAVDNAENSQTTKAETSTAATTAELTTTTAKTTTSATTAATTTPATTTTTAATTTTTKKTFEITTTTTATTTKTTVYTDSETEEDLSSYFKFSGDFLKDDCIELLGTNKKDLLNKFGLMEDDLHSGAYNDTGESFDYVNVKFNETDKLQVVLVNNVVECVVFFSSKDTYDSVLKTAKKQNWKYLDEISNDSKAWFEISQNVAYRIEKEPGNENRIYQTYFLVS